MIWFYIALVLGIGVWRGLENPYGDKWGGLIIAIIAIANFLCGLISHFHWG